MPLQMTERERQGLLAELRVTLLSVPGGGDRPPHATPVWYAYRPGGDVTFFTGTQGRKSRKAGLSRKAGVLSLTVQQEVFPYRYVTVEGTVAEEDRPPSVGQVPARAARSVVRRGGARAPHARVRAVHGQAGPLADLRLRQRGRVGDAVPQDTRRRRAGLMERESITERDEADGRRRAASRDGSLPVEVR